MELAKTAAVVAGRRAAVVAGRRGAVVADRRETDDEQWWTAVALESLWRIRSLKAVT